MDYLESVVRLGSHVTGYRFLGFFAAVLHNRVFATVLDNYGKIHVLTREPSLSADLDLSLEATQLIY